MFGDIIIIWTVCTQTQCTGFNPSELMSSMISVEVGYAILYYLFRLFHIVNSSINLDMVFDGVVQYLSVIRVLDLNVVLGCNFYENWYSSLRVYEWISLSVLSVCGCSCENVEFISGVFIHLVISGILPVILGNIRGLGGFLTDWGRRVFRRIMNGFGGF